MELRSFENSGLVFILNATSTKWLIIVEDKINIRKNTFNFLLLISKIKQETIVKIGIRTNII